jgi:hypothetical protein
MGSGPAQCLLPLGVVACVASVACGAPFTSQSLADSNDGSVSGLPPPDGDVPADAVSSSGGSSGGGSSGGGSPTDGPLDSPADSGSSGGADATPPDAGQDSGPTVSCGHTCPTGFTCVAGTCEDHAALHFYTTAVKPTDSNWSYGSITDLGSAFVAYPTSSRITATTLDLWSPASMQIAPSVFHNNGLAVIAYDSMSIGPGVLGIYTDATNHYSVVRWTAPASGSFAIDVTFTGISFSNTADASMVPETRATVGVRVGMLIGQNSSFPLNTFGDGNTWSYSAPAAVMTVGSTIDFYDGTETSGNAQPGGVSTEVKITAN